MKELIERLWESDEASALTNQAARAIEHLQAERDELAAKVAVLEKDARRYRWLKAQQWIELYSFGGWWEKDGLKFFASHRLNVNGTAHAPYESLDQTIDEAINVQSR